MDRSILAVCLLGAILVIQVNGADEINSADKTGPYVFKLPSADKGVCIIASFIPQIKIGPQIKTFKGSGELDISQSSCPNADNKAVITMNFEFFQLSFSLSRENNQTPLEVVSISGKVISNGTQTRFKTLLGDWKAESVDHSYACDAEKTIEVRADPQDVINIVISQMTIEAFRDLTKPDLYQTEDHCLTDTEASRAWVLIVAGLLVVVICFSAIAYLRRGQRS